MWNLQRGTLNLELFLWNLEPGTWNLQLGTVLFRFRSKQHRLRSWNCSQSGWHGTLLAASPPREWYEEYQRLDLTLVLFRVWWGAGCGLSPHPPVKEPTIISKTNPTVHFARRSLQGGVSHMTCGSVRSNVPGCAVLTSRIGLAIKQEGTLVSGLSQSTSITKGSPGFAENRAGRSLIGGEKSINSLSPVKKTPESALYAPSNPIPPVEVDRKNWRRGATD